MQSPTISKELEKHLFDLTLALYRVTDFFPPEEMLRKHLRGKADEVFTQVLEYSYIENSESAILKIIGYIRSVKGYLEIARSLQIVRPINIFVLEREYLHLADFFNKELKKFDFRPVPDDKEDNSKVESVFAEEKAVSNKEGGIIVEREKIDYQEEVQGVRDIKSVDKHQDASFLLNERQGVILEHLKQVGQAKISDFYSFFNDMSSKTIQRDLQDLVAKDLLKKEGEKRWTVYTTNKWT